MFVKHISSYIMILVSKLQHLMAKNILSHFKTYKYIMKHCAKAKCSVSNILQNLSLNVQSVLRKLSL